VYLQRQNGKARSDLFQEEKAMNEQPTYEELERRLSELELEVLHSEEAVRECEERYWVLFERSFDMVYIHDLEGKFMDASDIALDTLGYAREEIPDLTITSIICPEHMPLVMESIEDLMKTGIQKKTTEYKLRRKDGSFIWVETSASVIYRDGKPYAIQGIAHDITERKRAEDALRQNEERYRGILDNMEEGYFEEDLKGNFTFFNESARRMMGYDRDDMLGLNYRRFTSPETARRMFEVYHRVYETGSPERMVDYEVIRKDGSVRMHESSVVLLRDSSGQPVGFSELARDVTERKREEDILKKREERYRNILDSMEEAYFEVDLKGNLTFFNTTAVKRLGYTNEEVMGMSFHKFVDEENARKVFEGYHKVFLTGESIKGFDWELITGTGERIQGDRARHI
jgi:PAS domain S-box-containing protein